MEITLGKVFERLEIFAVKSKTRGAVGDNPTAPLERGSPGRIRTSDPTVNSRLLCQLSYWGIKEK